MQNRKSLALAAVLSLAGAATAEAAFLTEGAFRSSLGALNSHLDAMPAQSIVIADAYGTYTPATRFDLVYTGGPLDVGFPYPVFNPNEYANRGGGMGFNTPASTEAGQIGGSFGCHSAYYRCLGAHTITYKLPYEIVGISGMLDLNNPWGGQLSDIGFFEFPLNYVAPDGHPYRYRGFWADTFAPTDTLTIVWSPGVRNADSIANFLLTDAQVVRAVRVPEPGTLALLGTALLGLLAVRRKAA
jgi:hypothetical protein